jgi:hypothetical protein
MRQTPIKVLFDDSGSARAMERLAASLSADPEVRALMVLGCDANGWTPAEVDPVLSSLSKPVFGGIFPKIIHGQCALDRGVLVIGLPCQADIHVIPALSDPAADYEAALEAAAAEWTVGGGTFVVFVDGLSKRIAALVEALFAVFGLGQNYVGGGAGSLSFAQKPCLITPSGLAADAALLVRLAIESGVGVAHGWQPFGESMKATETEHNTVLSLDWHPARERYQQLVEAHSGRSFTTDSFFDLAKSYPLGISRLDGEVVVRDPLTTDARGGLVCVGEVPAGSFVYLLHGTPENLVAAAAYARRMAAETAAPRAAAPTPAFFIDCISRALFLEDRLGEELAAAAGGGDLFGAMTLGEIANSSRAYLEFYNKTAVVALLAPSAGRRGRS